MPKLPVIDPDSAGIGYFSVEFCGESVRLTSNGSLHVPGRSLLAVSDLHFGKSERRARLGGSLLPPYETDDTINRLEREIQLTGAGTVICLGDSFDDNAAPENLSETAAARITGMAENLTWIWITGNHDDDLAGLPGDVQREARIPPFTFRHIADSSPQGEISGHFHPKISVSVKGRRLSRSCFLMDRRRIIMPAFGTYTGGLDCRQPVLRGLMGNHALAVMTGRQPIAVPLSAAC